MVQKLRCPWCVGDSLMEAYHDEEWGVPLTSDLKWFEFLVLDSFQAGLSWKTILHRREGFRKAFANFDYIQVARFNQKQIDQLLLNEDIIRNRLKIYGTIINAQKFLEVQKEFGTFNQYIWQFTKGQVIQPKRKTLNDIPAITEEAIIMSKDLKKRGFKFVGPTICYAMMQASGMVNDHLVSCFRYSSLNKSKS